jgi:hypothetical protein
MSKANAIGTGALILSANADQMLSGLHSAGKAATKEAAKIGRDVQKAADKGGGRSGGGGLFGGLLGGLLGGGGLAGGIAGGAIVAGIGLLTKGLQGLSQGFEELQKRTEGGDKGSLNAISGSLSLIKDAGLTILQKVLNAAAPAIVKLTEVALNLFDRVGPLIGDLAGFFGLLGSLAAELAMQVLNLIPPFEGVGFTAMDAFRFAGKAAAYFFDSLKAGAGVIAYVSGYIVEGLGHVTTAIADVVKMAAGLAAKLPESIRPTWIGDAASAVDGFGARVKDAGKSMRDWGKGAVMGFGESAPMVSTFFDGFAKRVAETKKGIEGMVEPLKLGLSGAFEQGTAAAYSITAKFSANSMLAESRRQLQEQQKANGILGQIRDRLNNAPVIKGM